MSEAAHGLKLYIDNDGQLYHQQYLPIIKNLMTKIGRGTYDSTKSVKLWGYLCESGAKKYHREFGSPGDRWNEMFTVADRKQCAEALRDSFEAEAKLGNYDELLPKKYRAKKNAGKRGSGASRRSLLDIVYASPFLQAYFDTMLWAETADEGDDGDDRSWRDKGYTLDDIETKTLESLIADAHKFLSMPSVRRALDDVTKKWREQAGHDFWLTRQGAGAGFGDGDWPEPEATILEEAAEKIGEVWLYASRGKIYASR